MRKVMFLLVASTSLVSLGCATMFYDTEPADADHVYVVGARQVPFAGVQPAVWKCPAKVSGECKRVKVER